jgi:hypothetical protein
MTIRSTFAGLMSAPMRFIAAACALFLASCTGVPRVPFTQQEQSAAVIPGIPDARVWADDTAAIVTAGRVGKSVFDTKRPTILALSGGGANGAFGAGFLNGWSATGTRPQFTFVTGASAGALIAPFAFLGADHDETLRNVFASGEMANLLQSDAFAGLFGTGFFKAAPLRDLIARHVDAALLAEIAREYQKGRRLYVVTTNLDAQRTAIWDMGKIAASSDPQALELFRNVLTASASIPGVFSPIRIDVEAEGHRFAEMHVDGGVTTNILIVPEALLLTGTPLFPPDARPKVYIIMNGKLAPEFEVVGESTLKIVSRSIATAVRANTRNTLLASYEFTKTRKWEFNLAAIDAQFATSKSIAFDTGYMQQLFEYGYQKGLKERRWQSTPLD